MENPRRNPKRKVSEAAGNGPDNDAHDLLWKACSSLAAQDIEDWQGWVELESEPVWTNFPSPKRIHVMRHISSTRWADKQAWKPLNVS